MKLPNHGFFEIVIAGSDAESRSTFQESLCDHPRIRYTGNPEKIRSTPERILVIQDIHSASVTGVSSLAKRCVNAVIVFSGVDDTEKVLPYLCVTGVNGLFHQGESGDILRKGIDALEHGELFFPRDILPRLIHRIKLDSGHTADQLQQLSSKEAEVLRLLSSGSSNRDIAVRLNMSFHTVKTHIYNIYKKLDVKNRAGAIRLANSALV